MREYNIYLLLLHLLPHLLLYCQNPENSYPCNRGYCQNWRSSLGTIIAIAVVVVVAGLLAHLLTLRECQPLRDSAHSPGKVRPQQYIQAYS
jgi:hypothetical protein